MLSETGVVRLVNRVCRELDSDSPPPTLVFAGGKRKKDWRAQYEPNSKQITLPRPVWIKKFKVTTTMGYRLLVLHEVAHHLFGANHNDAFYHGLFGLCELYGVPLSFAYTDEHEYKPRGAARGLDSYLASLKEAIGGENA
jgi:hypothetical protein